MIKVYITEVRHERGHSEVRDVKEFATLMAAENFADTYNKNGKAKNTKRHKNYLKAEVDKG